MGRVTQAEPRAGCAQIIAQREGPRVQHWGLGHPPWVEAWSTAGSTSGFRACQGSLRLCPGDHGQDPFSPLSCLQTAEAQLAYELQSAREQQKIRQEEIEIEVVQRKKQIDVEEKEIIRKEKELIATVKRPAEAEAYRIQQIAEGEK